MVLAALVSAGPAWGIHLVLEVVLLLEAERQEVAGGEFLVSFLTHSLSAVWEES